jgi:hypothetical protein
VGAAAFGAALPLGFLFDAACEGSGSAGRFMPAILALRRGGGGLVQILDTVHPVLQLALALTLWLLRWRAGGVSLWLWCRVFILF